MAPIILTIDHLIDQLGAPVIFETPYSPGWFIALLKLPNSMSVSGKGPTIKASRTSCLGEAAEVLSCMRRPDDTTFPAVDIKSSVMTKVDAEEVTMADGNDKDDPGTEGCAAGPTLEVAQWGALMECVERHSLARWWKGEIKPNALPQSWVDRSGLTRQIETARRGATTVRHTHFLSVENVGPVITVLAYSFNDQGQSPIIGAAADTDPQAAARAALSELFQMEFALVLALIAQKTNDTIDHHGPLLKRIEMLAGPLNGLLMPSNALEPPDKSQADILEVAQALPGDVRMVNLTRKDVGVPVARALTPQLAPARKLKFQPNGGPV